MSLALTTDILLKSVGKRVKNVQNEHLGRVIEVTRNASGVIEYVILKSNNLFDMRAHFFAIPASSAYIKITVAGEVILLVSKDELRIAHGVTFDKRPRVNFHTRPPIFELYMYKGPQIENQESKTTV